MPPTRCRTGSARLGVSGQHTWLANSPVAAHCRCVHFVVTTPTPRLNNDAVWYSARGKEGGGGEWFHCVSEKRGGGGGDAEEGGEGAGRLIGS